MHAPLRLRPAASARMVEEFCASTLQNDGTFEEGAPLPSPFNTNYNEGGPSITADNTELYFTVCEDLDGYKNCDIYYTEKDMLGYWSSPRSVGDHINRKDTWESQASVTANGDWLYFTSDREGGIGGLDLYRCKRKADGTWSSPELLDAHINTRRDEKSPFIHSDSETLYFTSNGHPGLGGFDIFYARATDSSWQAPSNIGYPINGEKDDLGLFVSLDGKTGYFSSNTLRANTGWDLYSFEMPEEARPEEVFLLQGTLDVADGENMEEASIKIKNLKTKEVTEIKVDAQTGSYARVIEKLRPESIQPGQIVDLDGNVLGEHDGIINFTIGQRRGLDIGGHPEALYVVRLDPERRQVVVGPKEALAVTSVILSDVNWIGPNVDKGGVDCAVKIRSTMGPIAARMEQLSDIHWRTIFCEPQYGVSPGQACVAYAGERVLGGGWIVRGETQ